MIIVLKQIVAFNNFKWLQKVYKIFFGLYLVYLFSRLLLDLLLLKAPSSSYNDCDCANTQTMNVNSDLIENVTCGAQEAVVVMQRLPLSTIPSTCSILVGEPVLTYEEAVAILATFQNHTYCLMTDASMCYAPHNDHVKEETGKWIIIGCAIGALGIMTCLILTRYKERKDREALLEDHD